MSTPADLALESALGAPEPANTLRFLLISWSAYEAPAVADLIDVATTHALALRGTEREDAKTLDARQAQWLDVARAGDPLDVPWLVERVFTPRIALTVVRLNAVGKLARDPRIAKGLLAWTSRPGLLVRGSMWTRLLRIVRHQNDARSIATIDARLAAFETAKVAKTESEATLAQRLTQTRALLTARLVVPPGPREDLIAKLSHRFADPNASSAIAAAKTAEDFLAEIWAAPRDDGPREVFADWLTERGDVRGELIVLQIARARGRSTDESLKRERKLLAEYARVWLGPLAPVVKNFTFERGFMSRCEVMWRRLAQQAALMTHPSWATVHTYTLSPEGERSCDPWLDHMIALGAKRA